MLADVIHKVAQATQDDEQPYHPRPSMPVPADPTTRGGASDRWSTIASSRLLPPSQAGSSSSSTTQDHEDLTIKWLEKAAVTVYGRQLPVDHPPPAPHRRGLRLSVCGEYIPPDRMHGHIDALGR